MRFISVWGWVSVCSKTSLFPKVAASVDVNLLIRSQGKEEVFGLHGFVNESCQEFVIFFAVGKIVCLSQVFDGTFSVVRDHHAAGRNSCVAAALRAFFEDNDISAKIYSINILFLQLKQEVTITLMNTY